MSKLNPLLVVALTLTAAIAIWGIVDTANLAKFANDTIKLQFNSRAWFIMLTVSGLLITSIILALSKFGKAVSVAVQQNNLSSLQWWIKNTIAMRKRFKAFSRGNITFLEST
ncbi:MAG: hypothetical protein AAF346_11870, partial [Pseudomonadota bacterium]